MPRKNQTYVTDLGHAKANAKAIHNTEEYIHHSQEYMNLIDDESEKESLSAHNKRRAKSIKGMSE